MARQEAEWSSRLRIFWLKKNGYLDGGWRTGGIKWTYGTNDKGSSISFTVKIKEDGEEDNINLRYTHTSRDTGMKEDMDYKVPLTTTPCNLGGKRYWFICSLYKNAVYCGRRVGVLFCIGKWFGCRHCGNIAYAAQMEGGRFRVGSVTEPVVEKARQEVKREYYNGKPTRSYKRYLRLRDKMDNSLVRAAMKFGIRF